MLCQNRICGCIDPLQNSTLFIRALLLLSNTYYLSIYSSVSFDKTGFVVQASFDRENVLVVVLAKNA